ncbi:MAG: hypothetical protein EXS14_07865 [Planctomycetes bacterium]|nr:hypothetical protein [Planctomycetota bacterium]
MPTVFRGLALASLFAVLFVACQTADCCSSAAPSEQCPLLLDPAKASCAGDSCAAKDASCEATASCTKGADCKAEGTTCPMTGAKSDCGSCPSEKGGKDDCDSCPSEKGGKDDCGSCPSEKAPAGLLSTLAACGATEVWSAKRFDGCCVIDMFAADNELFALVAGPDGYEVHCIDLLTGVPRWLTNIGAIGLRTRLTVGDALVVCLLEDGAGMVVMKRRNGSITERRSVPMKLVPMGGAASSTSTVYVASLGDNAVHAINPADGLDGWRWRTEGRLFGAPVMTPATPRRLVVLAADNGEVVALPTSGWDEGRPAQAAWSRKLLGPMGGPVATYGSVTKSGSSTVVIAPCEDHGLYCLDGASGESRWVHRTDSAFRSQPQAAGGKVFAVNASGMQVVDIATGAELWTDAAKAPGQTFRQAKRMLAANATTVYMTCGKGVGRLDAKTGKLLGCTDLLGVDFVVETGDAGLLVGATRCGQISVLR